MKIRIGILLILPLLWLAPLLGDLGQIHMTPGADYSDLAIAHWPSAEFIRQSLLQYGEIPFWNPHTLGGTPFAADPLSGLYYPPLWLALILPAPLAFNILFLLHLAFAGIGAYLLARSEGAGQAGALLAGIAFGGLPKLVAHTGAGHLTLVLAVAWTPWLLLAARGAARARSIRGWSRTGVMAGIIFLIDPRWIIPSALAAMGYAFVSAGGNPPLESRRAAVISWAKYLVVFGGFAAAVSAVLALPMAQFVSLSTRSGLTGAESTTLSLPFFSLLGFLFGGFGNSMEWVVYPGAVVLALALSSPLIPSPPPPSPDLDQERGKGGEGWFWYAVFALSIFLSLGSNIPGLAALMDAIPGLNLLRVPPRWMFLAGLALAMLACRGLTGLESAADGRGILKKTGFTLAAGGLILAVAAGAMGLPAALWQNGLVWGALGLLLFAGFFSGRPAPWAAAALIGLTVIDLAVADGRMINSRSADPISDNAAQAASFLEDEAGEYRVYSPSYSIPQLAAVRYGLRTLDGIDPLILRSTAEIVSTAVDVPLRDYSVTLPAFASGQPDTDNRDAIPDWRLLGLLDVRFVASAFQIPSAMLGGCKTVDGIMLCRNLFIMPRAWVAEGAETWDAPLAGRDARIESESPNRMALRAEGPGLLVVSEAAYPAWRAAVDGSATEILTVGGWWRAVAIGPGEHEVEMRYDPALFRIGLALAGLALIAFLGVRRWAT